MIPKYREKNQWADSGVVGVLICKLWVNKANGGTAIIRMEEGSVFPNHLHLGWEQVFVLSGSIIVDKYTLMANDYLFTLEGETHSVEALEASELLVFSEKGAQIL